MFRHDFLSTVPKFDVRVYVKNNIKSCVYSDSGSLPNTLTLYLPTFNHYISTVYRPPSYTYEENIALVEFIYNLSANKELVLLGDFNLPTISWLNEVLDQNISVSDSMFLDLFQTLGLHQWV